MGARFGHILGERGICYARRRLGIKASASHRGAQMLRKYFLAARVYLGRWFWAGLGEMVFSAPEEGQCRASAVNLCRGVVSGAIGGPCLP